MSVTSSKIPRQIKAVIFKGEKHTIVNYKERYKPAGTEEIINEEFPKKSDQPRHGDLNRAMERMKVHLILRCEFAKPLDKFEKALTPEWWKDHLYEDDPRFSNVKITGVIVTSKETIDTFQILGEVETLDKQIVKIKSPSISTIKGEGNIYPLVDEAKLHLETLLLEADEYRKGKSSLGQLKMALVA